MLSFFSKSKEKVNLFTFSKENHYSIFKSTPPSINLKTVSNLEETVYQKITNTTITNLPSPSKPEESKSLITTINTTNLITMSKKLHTYIKLNDKDHFLHDLQQLYKKYSTTTNTTTSPTSSTNTIIVPKTLSQLLLDLKDESTNDCTLIHTISKYGRTEILQEILITMCKTDQEREQIINLPDSINATPIFYAIVNNEFQMVNMLIASKCCKVDVFDVFGNCSFFLSFFPKKGFVLTEQEKELEVKHHHTLKQFLLPNLMICRGVSILFEDNNGETVLFQLIKSDGDGNDCNPIVNHRNSNNYPNSTTTSFNPNHHNKLEKIRFLLSCTYDVDTLIRKKNKDGNNVFWYAVGQLDILNLLIEKLFIILNINEWFTDPVTNKEGILTVKNKKNENLFHRCADVGCIQSLLMLARLFQNEKELKREINWKNNLEQTPLHLSIVAKRYEVTQFLGLLREVDPNVQDINGNTPLHYCLMYVKGGGETLGKLAGLLINFSESKKSIKNLEGVTGKMLMAGLKLKVGKKVPGVMSVLNQMVKVADEKTVQKKVEEFFNEKVDRSWMVNKQLIEVLVNKKNLSLGVKKSEGSGSKNELTEVSRLFFFKKN